jgi:hypothetical protein
MTAAAFCTLCELLYGAGWQSKLARDLVRDIRTIRRWKSGESPVPKVVEEWLKSRESAMLRKQDRNDGP